MGTDLYTNLRSDNFWWQHPGGLRSGRGVLRMLETRQRTRGSAVFLGSRRTREKFILYLCISRLLDQGVPPKDVLYVSRDICHRFNISPETLYQYFRIRNGLGAADKAYVFIGDSSTKSTTFDVAKVYHLNDTASFEREYKAHDIELLAA